MVQIIAIGIFVVAVGVMTWGTGRMIDLLRSRDRVNERLQIDDC